MMKKNDRRCVFIFAYKDDIRYKALGRDGGSLQKAKVQRYFVSKNIDLEFPFRIYIFITHLEK